MQDRAFDPDLDGLRQSIDALFETSFAATKGELPAALPARGLGEVATLDKLAPLVLGGAQHLGAADAFAHMDPPTPWITWATTMWNASLNQNLLHPDTSPVARQIEECVVSWIAPFVGMDGGHITPGSTVANLTALWAARELRSIKTVVASDASHLSIAKAAHILGLDYRSLNADANGRLTANALDGDLSDAALVLTAGTTSAGVIDELALAGQAAWTHVDAAWAGALAFSSTHKARLEGIEKADSVSISAHKWLYQPKESGLILFKDTEAAHEAVSFGGAYLALPNIGVLGSRGASAVPLMATLLAFGRTGLAERIDRAMDLADEFWRRLDAHPHALLFGPQASGVILWRPSGACDLDGVHASLPTGLASRTSIRGEAWLRHVAVNPRADIETIWRPIERHLSKSA